MLKNSNKMQKLLKSFSKFPYGFSTSIGCDPLHPPQYFKPIYIQDNLPKYNVTKLKNGATIMTESLVFPSMIDLGVLFSVGTRNETLETSGSLSLIKSNFLKSDDSPDGLKNLEFFHNSGAFLEMDYDQETTYFKCSSLTENFNSMLDLVLKCALHTKEKMIDLSQIGLLEEEEIYKINDYLLMTAYGKSACGMPIEGLKTSIENINEKKLSNFYKDNWTFDKLYIGAAGVENHQEFVKVIEEKLAKFEEKLEKIGKKNKKNEYLAGVNCVERETEECECGVVFESVPWNNPKTFNYAVVNTILGNSLLNRLYYINSAAGVNLHFTDSGLFGLQASGPIDSASEICESIAKELKKLTQPIASEELERGKNILKSNIFMVLERQQDRLEETLKNVCLLENIVVHDYPKYIEKITSEEVQEQMKKTFASKETIVAIGKNFEKLNLQKLKSLII